MQGQEGGPGTGPQLLASVVPRSNAASATANMGLPSTIGASHAAYPHQLPHAQGDIFASNSQITGKQGSQRDECLRQQ